MSFELERILYETEDFLRRSLGSTQQRAAKKRKVQRQFAELMRRLRRAGLILAGLLILLIAASIAFGGIGFFTWVVALPTTMSVFAAMGVMITSATAIIYGQAIWDPVQLVGRFSSAVVVAIAMFTAVVATLAVNIAANVVSPATRPPNGCRSCCSGA